MQRPIFERSFGITNAALVTVYLPQRTTRKRFFFTFYLQNEVFLTSLRASHYSATPVALDVNLILNLQLSRINLSIRVQKSNRQETKDDSEPQFTQLKMFAELLQPLISMKHLVS